MKLVWGIQIYRVDVHTYGGIHIYGGHPNIWGKKHTGGIQTYGDIHKKVRHPNTWGTSKHTGVHPNMWGYQNI